MTEHGFGKVTIASVGPPGHDIILKFARKISRVPGVIRTHTQKLESESKSKHKLPPTGEWLVNQIIFEFGHVLTNYPDEYHGDYKEFFNRIGSIKVGPHTITTLEYWLAEDSVP